MVMVGGVRGDADSKLNDPGNAGFLQLVLYICILFVFILFYFYFIYFIFDKKIYNR